jgi:hypothetical protein
MELQLAREIINVLAQGIHPVTGEAMPPDSPYNEPPVIRALFAVSRALEQCEGLRLRREPAGQCRQALVGRGGPATRRRLRQWPRDQADGAGLRSQPARRGGPAGQAGQD